MTMQPYFLRFAPRRVFPVRNDSIFSVTASMRKLFLCPSSFSAEASVRAWNLSSCSLVPTTRIRSPGKSSCSADGTTISFVPLLILMMLAPVCERNGMSFRSTPAKPESGGRVTVRVKTL